MTHSKIFPSFLLITAIGTFNVQAQENLDSAVSQSTRAEQADPRDGFSVAPYIWFTYYSGTMTVNGQTINMSGTSVFDLLSAGDLNFPPLVGAFEWRLENGLGIFLDTTAIELNFAGSDTSLGPGPLTAALGLDFTYGLVNTGVVIDGHNWQGNGFSNDLDYMVGLRYTYYDLDLAGTIGTLPVSTRSKFSWADATLGVRLRGKNANGVTYSLVGDIGLGQGKSVQGLALIGKTWKKARTDFSVIGGYRVLYQDWSSGADAVDMTTHGPMVGMQWTL